VGETGRREQSGGARRGGAGGEASQVRDAVPGGRRLDARLPCLARAVLAAIDVAPVTRPADLERGAAAAATTASKLFHPAEPVGTRHREASPASPRPRRAASTCGAIRWPRDRPSHLTPRRDSTRSAPRATFLPVTLIVDIRHWLDEHGSLPLALFVNAFRPRPLAGPLRVRRSNSTRTPPRGGVFRLGRPRLPPGQL